MPLSVATYNIHGGIGRDRRLDLHRVAAVIGETGASVVGLQEVGDLRGEGPELDQAERLAGLVGMELVYAPNLFHGRRRYGNAILSRMPVLGARTYDLSVARREPRGCVRADLALEGAGPLHVFNLHLGLSWRERRRQAARLLSEDILRDAKLSFPAVVIGDFNFWFPGPVPGLLRSALVDVAQQLGRTAPTYPVSLPLLRLDRIFLGPGLIPLALRVHRSPLAEQASDHLPLVATLELAHPQGTTVPISMTR